MTPIDLNRLDRERREELSRHVGRTATGPMAAAPGQEESLGILGTAGDILAAPLRGVEGAAQDVYGLADTLAFDALPDWEERFFGESRTRTGGIIEGLSNFAAGFVPVYGWLGRAGKVGRLLEGSAAVRAAVAGAVTDFAVFDGHEERLANLVQSFPSLQNPVTEYLAADPNDSEVEGRLKNALEGLGVGLLTEGALKSFKALRAGRAARAAGEGARGIEAAMDAAVPPAELERALGHGEAPAPVPVEGASAVGPEAGAAVRPVEVSPAPAPKVAPEPTAILRTFGVDEKQAEAIYAEAKRRASPIGPNLEAQPALNPKVNPRDLTPAARLAQGMQEADLNLKHYQGPEGAAQFLRATEQLLEPLAIHGKATAKSLDQQETEAFLELADMVQEKNPQRLLVSLQRDVADLPGLNRRILAYKTALNSYAGYVDRVAKKLATPAVTDLDRLEFRQGLNTMAELELGVKSLLGEQGRGLGANRMQTRYLSDILGKEEIEEMIHGHGGARRIDDLAAKFRTVREAGGTAGVVDLARASAGRRAWAVFDEYWYNSLLGRPTTMVVNALSGVLTSIYRPMELMLGGALTGQAAPIHQAVREVVALVSSVPEAMRAAAAGQRAGGQLLDPRRLVHDTVDPLRKAISSQALGVGSDTVGGKALDWFGKLVRFPSAALTTTDQFVKHLNYRAVAKAQLALEASTKGLRGKAAAQFVADEMDKLIFEGQAYGSALLYNRGAAEAVQAGKVGREAIEEHARAYVQQAVDSGEHARLSAIAAPALERAEEATFSRPLRPGTLSYRVQEAAQNHRLLRLVLPFVRTPVNIASFALQRLDAPHAVQALIAKQFPRYAGALEGTRNRLLADVLSGNATRKADAFGRLAAGMSVATFVLAKAHEMAEDGMPMLTGRGPADREQRRIMEDAGWQPYSIRVGDTYVSYARLDPFASIFGTAADIMDYVRYAAPEDQSDVENLSMGIAVSLAQNFTNKTYLAGLANAIEAVQDPQRRVPKLVAGFAGSLVPGQAAAAVSVTDPLMRDVRTMADTLRSRLPGASETLPPMRNVLGEPVHRANSLGGGVSSVFNAIVPFLYRETSDDGITRELAALNHGFTPPKRTLGTLDLTTVAKRDGQNAYDRWLELHGEVEIGGRNLRQALRRVMNSAAYKRMPVESTDDLESPRISLVQNVIDDYRHYAFRRLLREFPELDTAERGRRERKARARQGRSTLDQLRGRG